MRQVASARAVYAIDCFILKTHKNIMTCVDRQRVVCARAFALCIRRLMHFKCVRDCILKTSRLAAAQEGHPSDVQSELILASALHRYGFPVDDLRALVDLENLPNAPSAHNLVVDGTTVRNRDGAALGNVRMADGSSRAIYACRLGAWDGFFPCDERHIYLQTKNASALRVVAMVSRRRWRKALHAQKPLGAVLQTEYGENHPCDDGVVDAIEFLLRKA